MIGELNYLLAMKNGTPASIPTDPRPATAEPAGVASTYVSLRDHQPDIRFQGNSLRLSLLRHRSQIAFISCNIKLELQAMAATTDQRRWGQGRSWVIQAQKWRRAALADASAHERLLVQMEFHASLTGPLQPKSCGRLGK